MLATLASLFFLHPPLQGEPLSGQTLAGVIEFLEQHSMGFPDPSPFRIRNNRIDDPSFFAQQEGLAQLLGADPIMVLTTQNNSEKRVHRTKAEHLPLNASSAKNVSSAHFVITGRGAKNWDQFVLLSSFGPGAEGSTPAKRPLIYLSLVQRKPNEQSWNLIENDARFHYFWGVRATGVPYGILTDSFEKRSRGLIRSADGNMYDVITFPLGPGIGNSSFVDAFVASLERLTERRSEGRGGESGRCDQL